MKYILIFFLSLQCIANQSIPKYSIGIIKKNEVYSLVSNCKDSIQWEEIVIKDSVLQNKINLDICSLIKSFKADSIYFESICEGSLLDESTSTVVYSKDHLISVLFTQQYIYPNVESSTYIRTLNYSLKTGKVINFHELFKPEKQGAIDSLILAEIKKWYAEFEMSFDNIEIEYTQVQLKNPQFSIEDDRIVLYMRAVHCGYCTDEDPAVVFDFNEYENYFNRKGVLKTLLQRAY